MRKVRKKEFKKPVNCLLFKGLVGLSLEFYRFNDIIFSMKISFFTSHLSNINILNGWNDFWNDLGESFVRFFTNLKDFWLGSGTGENQVAPYLGTFTVALLVLFLGYFVNKLILKIVQKIFKIDKKIIKEKTVKNFVLNTLKVILYFILFLIVLSILRVDLSGVASIFSSAILAIGLALQDVISNFASGVIILSNKPFVIGDYVNVGNGMCEGTVTNLKFLSTTIETVDKQVITVPNKTITSEVVMNYTSNPIRRLKVDLLLDYRTDINKAREILVEVANNDNRILLDPLPVAYVTDIKGNVVNISLRCFVPNTIYWNIYFDVYANIVEKFKENSIKAPYNSYLIEHTSEAIKEG